MPKLASPGNERLISLDAFRGFTIALMVVVNNPGSDAIYYQLRHAPWNGWTVADTIFPSFLWIMGAAITISLGKRLAAATSRRRLMVQALRRAVILYVLGLIVYIAPAFDLRTQRLLGVLQRIAVCYAISAAIYLHTGVRGQIVWLIGLLAAYWLIMTLMPVPGYGRGDLSVAGNFAHYVDKIVMGRHNYLRTKTWDPEGIVSTIPSIATTLFGLLAGRILQARHSISERAVWSFVAGNSLILAGLVCNIWLPINKHIWTSSFSIFMAGIDFVTFAGFLWLVDGCGYTRFAKPLSIVGMNAIAIYMLSELLAELLSAVELSMGGVSRSLQNWIYTGLFAAWAPASLAALLYAIAFTLLMCAFGFELYRRKWILRV